MDAVFNVYKPRGPTSHDVVARLRRAAGVRRVGHAGTLDPLAEGVLVVATGKGTRVIEYLAGADKGYLAEVTLGIETDTYDTEGRIIAERSAAMLTEADIETALAPFRGLIEQTPPAHSAVKVAGRRLYDLARRGQSAQVAPRPVQVHRLELVAWAAPVAKLLIECSKGTYVRSLAHDLGRALACGAHLSGLVRQRSGTFLVQNALPLDDLEAQLRDGRWQAVAIAPDVAVAHLPAVHLDAGLAQRLTSGLVVAADTSALELGALARAYAPGGAFIAIVRRGDSDGRPEWRPEKVFTTSS